MPLNRRAISKIKDFNLPLSYKVDEEDLSYRDSRNFFYNKGKIESRYGYSRYNSTVLAGNALSLSYFKETDGTRHIIAKIGASLYTVSETGAHTDITGSAVLTASTKHRGITLDNRHIISIESDGAYQFDGTTLTQLGQAVPAAPSVAAASSGSITSGDWAIGLTFYDSTNGFETNVVTSADVTVNGSQKIAVTSIPASASNANIDFVRVYLKDVTNAGNFLFVKAIAIGVTSTDVTDETTSTQVPPTTHGEVPDNNVKYLTEFNRQLILAGSSNFPNDVYFSEQDLPDAFDDTGNAERLFVSGQGPITGIATGFYDDSNLDPYLIIFKRTSTHIYSVIGGLARLVTLNDKIGCVSNETIALRNGDIFFLSANGWRAITNGKLIEKSGRPITLDEGRIGDIFNTSGFIYELNKNEMENFFSVYYSTLDHYITFISEGTLTSKSKAYNLELETGNFRPYEFALPFISGTIAEDSTGEEIALFADENGYIYKHSRLEDRTDVDSSNTDTEFNVFGILNWFNADDDYDASYSFRELKLRAITSGDDITLRAFVSYTDSLAGIYTLSFPDPNSGFVLDVSKLDEGIFSDGRAIVSSRADINLTGINISIGFYQSVVNGNINIINGQLHYNKNGNPNTN